MVETGVGTNVESDRLLVGALLHQDTAALGKLYDRYAPLVYTLACQAIPAHAEAVLETVFGELWRRAPLAVSDESMAMTLIRLTSQVVARYRADPDAARESAWAVRSLPALTVFADLPPLVGEVTLLATLGQLGVDELTVALEHDRATVVRSLAHGLRFVRPVLLAGAKTAVELERFA